MSQVKFICLADSSQKIIDFEPGERLSQVAHRAGVIIQQTCAGTPSCTDCKIKVLENSESIFEPAEGPEIRLLGNVYYITKERLACQAILKDGGCVEVPDPKKMRSEKSLKKRPSQANLSASSKELRRPNGKSSQKNKK